MAWAVAQFVSCSILLILGGGLVYRHRLHAQRLMQWGDEASTVEDNEGAVQIRESRRISSPRYLRGQATACRFVAALLLIPGLPLMASILLLVRLTSRGPAIYRQTRVGKDGRTFYLYKIRSMYINAEAMTGPAWTLDNDPRITPIGRFLRKHHLDRLPQLFNVLKGEMSLIGPRPERPEFTHVLGEEIPGFLSRLVVLPGILGLAQINLPPDSDMNSVRRKLVLDLEYIATANLLLDVRMFACTLLRMIGLPGALATRVMRLQRTPEIAEDCEVNLKQQEPPVPRTIISTGRRYELVREPPTPNSISANVR